MKDIKLIKLFISCPGDIKDELDSIRLIIQEYNKTLGAQNNFLLELINWKQDTYSAIGDDAQDVVNAQIEKEFDILIGLLWQKLGTPTKRDKSGTVEEINRAITNKEKAALVYFKTSPPDNLNELNLEQLKEVRIFKEELSERGFLYKEFNTISEFETLFRVNISSLIHDRLIQKNIINDISTPTLNGKYSDIENLITTVENNSESPINSDVYETIEELLAYLTNITDSTTSITESLNNLSHKLDARTLQFQKIGHFKDDKLRLIKVREIASSLADELDFFNSNVNLELPKFSENFQKMGFSYSQLMLSLGNYQSEEIENLIKNAKEYRDTIEYSTNQSAGLLREVMKWPSVNFKFNKAKRETELALKDLTKEMLNGLKLLNEALN